MAKPITIKITGDTTGLAAAAARSDGIMSGMAGKARLMAAGVAAAGAVAVGKLLVSVGSMAEAMESVIVKGTGASGEALDSLMGSAKDVMSSVPDSGEIVASTLADVNTFLGLTGDALADTTESILDFSRLTGTTAADTTAAIQRITSQFGEEVDADELMGDWLRISQATGTSVDDLIASFEKSGGVLDAFGFSIEESAAVLGTLEKAGVNLRKGRAGLEFFLDKAIEAGEDPREALETLTAEMERLGPGAESTALAMEAFGPAGAELSRALSEGALNSETLNALMGEGAGLVDAQTAATETMGEKWNTIKNQVFVKLMPVAEALFKALKDGMDAMGPIIADVVVWYKEVLAPEIEKAMVSIKEIIEGVVAIVTTIWEKWGEEIMAVVTIIWDTIRSTIQAALRVVQGVIDVFAGIFTGDWQRIWDGIKNIVGGVFDSIVARIAAIPAIILALGPTFLDAGKGLMGSMLDGMLSALRSTAGFVRDLVSGLWDSFKSLFNTNVVDKINNAIPNKIALRGLPDINLPDNPIPRLSFGGDVGRGGQVLVGERGPEVVTLPGGSRVAANHDARGIGPNITVNAMTNANPSDIAGEIAWLLQVGGV
jgi:phage-related protein